MMSMMSEAQVLMQKLAAVQREEEPPAAAPATPALEPSAESVAERSVVDDSTAAVFLRRVEELTAENVVLRQIASAALLRADEAEAISAFASELEPPAIKRPARWWRFGR